MSVVTFIEPEKIDFIGRFYFGKDCFEIFLVWIKFSKIKV